MALGDPQPLTIQPQIIVLQPGPAECAKPLKSAAPRMGVHGVLDCTNGVAEVIEALPADGQEAEEESADPLIPSLKSLPGALRIPPGWTNKCAGDF